MLFSHWSVVRQVCQTGSPGGLKRWQSYFLYTLLLPVIAKSQQISQLSWQANTYQTTTFQTTDGKVFAKTLPLLAFDINGQTLTTDQLPKLTNRLVISVVTESGFTPGIKLRIRFQNTSPDTIRLSNVVPLGRQSDQIYITGKGNHPLSRAHLFRPGGYAPVNCILPDNAWELGYIGTPLTDSLNVCALTRRDRATIQNGVRRRFETVLYPKTGEVTYDFYADLYQGDWQAGLRKLFQERYLYDLPIFDNTLFKRPDLNWIRHAYLMHLVMAWSPIFYDASSKQFGIDAFLKQGAQQYGGNDVLGLWPTWPTLGLDQRNQFDMFRDLPGGLPKLRSLAQSMRQQHGTRFFVCYNPWDESTRSESHLTGLERILRETGADGVVLDTKGESSRELQAAADKVKPGIVMYSEGMAVPKDMPGIVSGRVHNALYYPPLLNLNKFIRPDFAIFRVVEVNKEPVRREFNVAFFNGYGTEINLFLPGMPAWLEEQNRYLGRTTRILRENTTNFAGGQLTPLLATRVDSVYVNRWTIHTKVLYTVLSLKPAGYQGELFGVTPKPGYHFVSLWHHRELPIKHDKDQSLVTVSTDAFNQQYLGTNNESAVDCIAQLPELLTVDLDNDQLTVTVNPNSPADEIRIWAGEPDYAHKPLTLKPGKHEFHLLEQFGRYEGKVVIQLFQQGILQDERIMTIIPGTPRLASCVTKTAPITTAPAGMVHIPAGSFTFRATHGDEFISYPTLNVGKTLTLPSFWIDKYPVTNAQFAQFLAATHYRPTDALNFLKHWISNRPPKGQEQYPVVWISYEDAQAYARWAGKRLPTEVEWQYAAQAGDNREWPWSAQTPGVRREIEPVNETLSVYRIKGLDSTRANLGNGHPDPVGHYPAGANPYGLQDLVGSIWQLTNDLYVSGSYRYGIVKGGSYYSPSSSWWYVQGGPRELHYRQFLLRVSPGFERNATVGFRCVRD